MTKGSDPPSKSPKPHRGVYFNCCRVYGRIVLNVQRTAFVGWCPKCAGKLELSVGPDGTDAAFFEAG